MSDVSIVEVEEYGYTIEEWYGKKSKMYKEHVKKSKKK